MPPKTPPQTIGDPPSGLSGWREVWSEDRRYPTGGVARWIGGLFERFRRAETDRQRDFNLAVLDLISDTRRDVQSLHSDVLALHKDLIDSAREVAGRLDRDFPVIVARGDALVAALDRKIESLAVRLRDLSTAAIAVTPGPQFQSDFLYRRLEDSLRGGEDEIRAAMGPYLELAATHQPLLDIGCGRGELLVMCAERGIEAQGFDTNERSVADLQARGLNVAIGAVPDALRALAEASLGSIVASHVVEHLPAEALIALFAEGRRLLRPGGLLMIETPNAESMQMTAADFWRDPTHLAPRHAAALVLLGREFGFSVEELATLAPYPESRRFQLSAEASEDVRHLAAKLNETLFADQNLRLVLRRT